MRHATSTRQERSFLFISVVPCPVCGICCWGREKITAIMSNPRRHQDYAIGWICPLPVEQTIALLMLDETHDRLPQQPADQNIYTLGSIGDHNIVIAGLHQPGNSPAATVVTQMRNTFPNIHYVLLVGIGGGVPVRIESDWVRLGDVVVCKPIGEYPGVV
ncbi:hypothetical protein F9C07_1807649 [Aspergillus flavus]|uniref:Nucleoside phosphorylase domain-containing protein n=1 Tax=Aspergillus flavus (strain ATCC 200026 / FGSC A1120 / IAM 13836 / NRRL 3357 / JCM 12722 / SRRC 167) TaxID=332952 RepID=A0A7U2R3X4_ASPFN|nr:hypothetical protein F9C07_1807649 [Aspergillus flavus]